MDYLFTAQCDGQQRKVTEFRTSMMLPRFLDTSFWKDLLLRPSFPLEESRYVVTIVLIADSISKRERDKKP